MGYGARLLEPIFKNPKAWQILDFGIGVLIGGVILLLVAIFLCCGFVNLLHEYHRNNISPDNERKLGLSIGLSLIFGSSGLISSGLVSVIVRAESIIWLSMILLFVPLVRNTTDLCLVIKKLAEALFGGSRL